MPNNVLELWLVRHGETLWNREGRALGQSDPPLNELGIQQAECLAKRIGHLRFDAVYASDLSRTRYTSRLVLPAADVQLEPRLREIDFGAWEGKYWREMEGADKRALDAWFKDPYRNRAPEGESYEDLLGRVREWLGELPKSGRAVAFTHGGTIRSALYHVTGLPHAQTWRFQVDLGSVTRLVIGDMGIIVSKVNDTSHLGDLQTVPD